MWHNELPGSSREDALGADWELLEEQKRRIRSALEHIRTAGHLEGLAGAPNEKLALINAVTKQGLAKWNRTAARYELTRSGRKSLPAAPAAASAAHDHAAQSRGAAVSARMIAILAGVALGAAFMVWLAADSTTGLASNTGEAAKEVPTAAIAPKPEVSRPAPVRDVPAVQAPVPRPAAADAARPAAAPPPLQSGDRRIEDVSLSVQTPGPAPKIAALDDAPAAVPPTPAAPSTVVLGESERPAAAPAAETESPKAERERRKARTHRATRQRYWGRGNYVRGYVKRDPCATGCG